MTSLMTAAPILDKPPEWIPTGSQYVALPHVSRLDAGVYSVGVISYKDNGLLEICGSEEENCPFLKPVLRAGGRRLELGDLRWERLDSWLPRFHAATGGLELEGTLFAPPSEKGFMYLLDLYSAGGGQDLRLGVEGWWKSLDLVVFSARPLDACLKMWQDPWTHSLLGEASAPLPLLGWGMQASQEGELSLDEEHFEWTCPLSLQAGEHAQVAFTLALNQECDGARTSALHLRRRGWQNLLQETRGWLQEHSGSLPDSQLNHIFHENLFFNYFYSQGLCLDTGDLALMTSRSRSYYVSAAYWARDAFLWSFPALLLADTAQARRVLALGLTRYLPNTAQHALYLNGQVLYPGFELDEACAPLIGLGHYLERTSDLAFLQQPFVLPALEQAAQALTTGFDAQCGLFSTFLTPHDDPTEFPFLTYDNVLVWRSLRILAQAFERLERGSSRAYAFYDRAARLKLSILEKCVCEGPFGKQFAAAVDAHGGCDLQDLPGGSWSLFSYYGFCSLSDPIYQNSLKWISSQHNPQFYTGKFPGAGAAHFPYPSSFDLANRLLRQDAQALAMLKDLKMDHGLACESFDPQTGVVRTGAAFATMAGFLAYALWEASGRGKGSSSHHA